MKAFFFSFIALLATAPHAAARNCAVSKEFRLNYPQTLAGAIEDPSGAVIQGMKMELLSGKRVVRSLHTNNLGQYDFGQLPSGKYKLRVKDDADDFCAPPINCQADHCSIGLQAPSNHRKSVIVY